VRDEIGNPEALGWLMGVLGGSALAGALLYGTVGHRLPRRPIYVATFVTVAASLWIMATVPPLPVALLGMAIFGLAAGPLNPILRTVRNERVPAELRGRVFGAMLAIGLSAMPLGVVAGGLLIEAIGVGPTFAIIAACYLAATLSQAVNPVLREMDRPRPSA